MVGWIFFGISLAAAAAAAKMLWLPHSIRELARESLKEERTFRAIGALPLRVEGY